MPGFPVFHYFAEFPQTHVFELVMPSHTLILLFPLLLPTIFPSIRVSSNELGLHIRWPKCWSFNFSLSPSIEYSSTTSKTKLMFPNTWQFWTLIKFSRTGILSSGKSQHCRPAFVLPLSPPGIELLPYTFSSLKPLADPSLSAVQELFLPPSLKTSACSLIVLCISVQFSLSVMFHSLLYRGVHHARLPCTSLTPRACSDPCLSSWWCHQTISSSVFPCLLLPLIFPSIKVLYNESVLPINWPK